MFNQRWSQLVSLRCCDAVCTVSWQCFGNIPRDSERNHPRHMTMQCGLVRESQLQDFACVQWRKQRDIYVRFMSEVRLRQSGRAAGGSIQRPSKVEGHHWRKSDFRFALAAALRGYSAEMNHPSLGLIAPQCVCYNTATQHRPVICHRCLSQETDSSLSQLPLPPSDPHIRLQAFCLSPNMRQHEQNINIL